MRAARGLLNILPLLLATGAYAAVGLFLPQPLLADTLLLRSGGRVEGTWSNPRRAADEPYVIETAEGMRLEIPARAVQAAIPAQTAEKEYEQLAPGHANTVEDQWALAEWCRERRLVDQRNDHLRRVVELDPQHARARRALGYSYINGQWIMEREHHERQGYLFYNGSWRTAQEIALIEERKKRRLAESEWGTKIKRLRGQLAKDRSNATREAILAINDPHAVAGLFEQFKEEPSQPVRLLYVNVLGNIESPHALDALLEISLNDVSDDVRHEALDIIVERKPAVAVPYYVSKLKDPQNWRLNRAAIALARLEDSAAIGPLIGSLVTRHKFATGPIAPKSDEAISSTFGRSSDGSGGSGLSIGNQSKIVERDVPNQDVLAALVKLTGGVNFSYDQTAWRYWHNARLQSEM